MSSGFKQMERKSKIKDKKSKLQVPDSIGTKILTARGERTIR